MNGDIAKPHISPTQLESFSRCGEAYRRRYLEGEIIPPGVALIQGSAVHIAAATNFRQKRETHSDLPASEIVGASVAAFESAMKGDLVFTREEEGHGVSRVLAEAKDETAMLAYLHALDVAPEYQPVLVEERVRLSLPNAPRDLLGVIDLADTRGLVVDHKTSKRKKQQDEADSSLALTYYSAAHEVATGRPATGVRLEVLVKTKAPTRQVLDSTRGPADYDALAARINTVLHAIDAGVFPPASPGAWWCSPDYCGYHSTCPYVRRR